MHSKNDEAYSIYSKITTSYYYKLDQMRAMRMEMYCALAFEYNVRKWENNLI